MYAFETILVCCFSQELEDFRAELERVTSERNSLAAQIASDAQKLQERIQNATRKGINRHTDCAQLYLVSSETIAKRRPQA